MKEEEKRVVKRWDEKQSLRDPIDLLTESRGGLNIGRRF